MSLSRKRRGESSILLSALLWSFFPIITILSYSTLPPLYTAAFSTLIGAAFFAAALTAKRAWGELLIRAAWKSIAQTTFFIGILFYGCMFLGIRYTSAGNASIMALMEVFFSFLILGLFLRHEHVTLRTAIGGGCMVLGALFVLLPQVSGWHGGDLLVLLATAFPPLGNRAAQEARSFVSAETIMFCRSLLSGIFLLLLAWVVEPLPSVAAVGASSGFLAINGVLLLGLSKILWIEGISLIPITEAISLESMTPVLTLIAAFFVLHERILPSQIAGLVPIVTGLFLLTRQTTSATS